MRFRIETIGIPILFLLTRSFGWPKILYNTDVIQFALALDRMDLAAHQPHPPGYIWFVLLGRFFRLFTGNDRDALIIASLFLGLIVLILLQKFTAKYFGRVTSIYAGLLFCVSPMSWFFSVVGLNYMADALIAISGAMLFYMPKGCPDARSAFYRALVGALLIGFRPQALIFIVPVWVYFFILCKEKRFQVLLGFISGTLIWVGVTMAVAGSVNIVKPAMEHVLRPQVAGYADLAPSLEKLRLAAWQTKVYLDYTLSSGIFFVPLMIIAYMIYGGLRGRPFRKFFLILTLPHFLFSLFIFIIQPGHFVYQLPLLIMMLAVLLGWMYKSKSYKIVSIIIVGIFILSMINTTFFMPISDKRPNVGYREIRRSDQYYTGVFEAIGEYDNLGNTIILCEDFRHVFYYFPEACDIGFSFIRLKMLGDNPLVLQSGKKRKFEPVTAETVDSGAPVFRIEAGNEYERLIYFGRGKWQCVDDDLIPHESSESVAGIILHPDDYIYFGPGRTWWVGPSTETTPPHPRIKEK